MSDNSDYQVGRGRPPKHTRFKPGRSGNPHGRRKCNIPKLGDDDFILAEFLAERMTIKRQNKPCRVTRHRLLYLRLFEQAMQGEIRALKMLLELGAKLPSQFKDDSQYIRLTSDDRKALGEWREAAMEWIAEDKSRPNDRPTDTSETQP